MVEDIKKEKKEENERDVHGENVLRIHVYMGKCILPNLHIIFRGLFIEKNVF